MSRVLASLLLAAVGCGDLLRVTDGGAEVPDAGGATGRDGAFDVADGDMDPPGVGNDDGALFADGRSEAASDDACYPAPGVIACEAEACLDLRSCCVGSGDCCAPVTGALPTLSFPACAGSSDLEACLGGVRAFGSVSPSVTGEALSPGGSVRDDGGLVVGAPVDLTVHKLTLSATFEAPTAACDAGCVEAAAIGITDQAIAADGGDVVQPLVALLYGGARGEVSLVLGGEVVMRWSSAMGDRWTLTMRPTGEVLVHLDDEPDAKLTTRYVPPTAATAVIYGRNGNLAGAPGAVLGARVSGFSATASLCDLPDTFGTRRAIVLSRAGTGWEPSPLGRPAMLDDGATRWVAVTDAEGIYVGEATSTTTWELPTDLPQIAATDASRTYGRDGVSDPALVREGDGLAVYFAAHDGERSTIARAFRADGQTAFTVDAAPLLTTTERYVSFEQPAAAAHDSGETVVVARALTVEGATELAIARGLPATPWIVQASDLGELTRRSGQRVGSGFDADDIASPALIVHDGAWQLFYAGRRGTRWAIGSLVSDQLLRWRAPVASEVLGRGDGFDRLGVLGPAAASIASDDRVELCYVGVGSARIAIGCTARAATNAGAPGR